MAHSSILIHWTRYPNFFALRRTHARENKMLYVIGEERHCYIGSIGSRKENSKGLGNRYQSQYVKRTHSIFGLDESAGQVAFAGIFIGREQTPCSLILAAEGFVQARRVERLGLEGIAFRPIYAPDGFEVVSIGEAPAFLLRG